LTAFAERQVFTELLNQYFAGVSFQVPTQQQPFDSELSLSLCDGLPYFRQLNAMLSPKIVQDEGFRQVVERESDGRKKRWA
jgi:hypothetical protein